MTARELLAAATPRPWSGKRGDLDELYTEFFAVNETAHSVALYIAGSEEDCALIVGAVNEYEALLDIVDALDAPAVTAALHRAAADATLDPEAFDRDFATLSAVFNARTRLDAIRSAA